MNDRYILFLPTDLLKSFTLIINVPSVVFQLHHQWFSTDGGRNEDTNGKTKKNTEEEKAASRWEYEIYLHW